VRATTPAKLAQRKRIVITSADDTPAVMLPPPDMTSFLYNFLSSAYMGNSMGEAWRAGRSFYEAFNLADEQGRRQTPQLDDGTTTSTPGVTSTARADKDFFGATWAYGVQSTKDINSSSRSSTVGRPRRSPRRELP